MPRKWLAIIIVSCFIVSALLYSIHVFDRLGNVFYDTLRRITAGKPGTHDPVVLVTATEGFAQQLGHEPGRKDYANLINLLNDCKLIVSDIFFPTRQSEETDSILRHSFSMHSEKIILPVFTPFKLKEKFNEVSYNVHSLNENHPYFQSEIMHLGHINVFPDSDTIVRKCPAFIFYKGRTYPHVAIKALMVSKNIDHIRINRFKGFKRSYDTIPVDEDGCFLIKFLKPDSMTDMIYTMEDVLTGKIQPRIFKDKIVVIGHTIIGSKNADLIPTPFGVQFGAMVQMQALHTILAGNYIWSIAMENILIVMGIVLLCSLIAFRSFWAGTRFFVVAFLFLLYIPFFLFKNYSVFLNPVPILFPLFFSYGTFVVMNLLEAKKEVSRGHQLLSVLESTQREIAALIRPHEMPGMQKRVYLPVVHDTFFNRTPQLTLQTINGLLGIYDSIIFTADVSTKKVNVLVCKENSSISENLILSSLNAIGNDRVKIYNKHLPAEFEKSGIYNFLILRILEEPFMNIYGLFINKGHGGISTVRAFTKNDYQWIASFCLQIVVALFNTQLNDALRKSQFETIMRLAAAIEYRDRETGMHITRVSEYCGLIATAINLPQIEVELIKAAVPLHDLGKIAIPDSVLLKPSALTEEEKEIIRTHTITGAKMLEGSDSFILQAAYLIALYHHEKFDGTGYPYGLKGNAIPLYGRIASLADVFDALSSSRVYKQAESFESSIKKIEELAGKDFDPQIVVEFLKNKSLVFEIYTRYQENKS
ncbi:MAG: CHASE2 domain-containing protein [bacterium]|nr:CHASE2 domain-containing protein [bacterium]